MKALIVSLFTITLLFLSNNQVLASKYYGQHLCAYPEFTCIKIKRGDSWSKLFPNRRHREVVKRLNRTNVALRNRTWIVVPNNLNNIDHMDLSPFPLHIKSMGKRVIYINLKVKAFGAYSKNGKLVHWGPVSGGRGWCSDVNRVCETAVGSYMLFRKHGPECESSKFPVETEGGAPMPYCMFYYRGFALHASTLPGYHASHGCIRLFFDDAKWLNNHFGRIGTKVIVTNS